MSFDVIVGIEDKKITNFDDLYGALDGRTQGEQTVASTAVRNRLILRSSCEVITMQLEPDGPFPLTEVARTELSPY